VHDKVEIENRTFTKITSGKRLQRRMIGDRALREAVINAMIHNDYSYGATPKVELFSDRLEITSVGELPSGLREQDFFSGVSVPRSKELMRVFKDLDFVEALGSGVPRIQSNQTSANLNRSIKTIERQIKTLVEMNFIERRGSKKTGGYWVVRLEKAD